MRTNTDGSISRVKSGWHHACHGRGLLRPNAANLTPLLDGLDAGQLQALEEALYRCVNGAEHAGDFALLNWAAKSTSPAVFGALADVGLSCTATELYLAGVSLMATGWDMSGRLVNLKDCPGDIEALRRALEPHQVEPAAEAVAPGADAPEVARGTDGGPRPQEAPPRPVPSQPSQIHEVDLPAGEEEDDEPLPAPRQEERTRLKLYGTSAAHTVEIGPHRRGGDFLGSHVVTFESARALAGGTYDWGRKLTFQLTPEEMPAAIAVLMNIQPSARFEYHGKARDKFLELRWQGSGLAVITGQKSLNCVVPVRSSAVYYLLSLFCRAMVQGQAGVSVSDVLAMVGALPGADSASPKT